MNNYIHTGRLVGDRRGRRRRNAEKQEAGTQKASLGNSAHLARHTLVPELMMYNLKTDRHKLNEVAQSSLQRTEATLPAEEE